MDAVLPFIRLAYDPCLEEAALAVDIEDDFPFVFEDPFLDPFPLPELEFPLIGREKKFYFCT